MDRSFSRGSGAVAQRWGDVQLGSARSFYRGCNPNLTRSNRNRNEVLRWHPEPPYLSKSSGGWVAFWPTVLAQVRLWLGLNCWIREQFFKPLQTQNHAWSWGLREIHAKPTPFLQRAHYARKNDILFGDRLNPFSLLRLYLEESNISRMEEQIDMRFGYV